MILIETPSPVTPPHSSAPRQRLLAPIVMESELLGKGGFGVVFGPYTASKMRNIITRLYRPPIGAISGCLCTPMNADICAACLQVMSQRTGIVFSGLQQVIPNGDARYILKVERKTDMAPCKKLLVLSEAVDRLSAVYHPYFIRPLVCGMLSFGRFEVQPYGGKELFQVLTDGQKWTSFDPLKMAVRSLTMIAKACFLLIDEARLFITDLKPENMVIHENGLIRLIDLEYVDLGTVNKKNVVFTMNNNYIPIQFINPAFFPDKYFRRRSVQKYMRMVRNEHGDNVVQGDLSVSTLEKISKFTIMWAFSHILYFIVEHKYPTEKKLHKSMMDIIFQLKRGNRWRNDMNTILEQMERVTANVQ